MFDSKNLVCRLFVAYCLEQHTSEYTSEGCLWIVNTFYDEVETYKGPRDSYQHAAMRTPLGYAAFFINAERHYELAEINRRGQTGSLLLQAELKAASTPVDYSIHIRKDEKSGLWKMYQKLGRGQYELISRYERTAGFSSKSKAEKRARELEVLV